LESLIDEHGEASEWVDFGDNDISDGDFVVDTVTVDKPPVLLVHGFQLRSFDPVKTWAEMGEELTGIREEEQVAGTVPGRSFWKLEKGSENGVTVYISNYSLYTDSPTFSDIRYYAHNLAEEIQAIGVEENVNKVDIVAHSMGGLVTRAYIENGDFEDNPYGTEYRNDIKTLIMLGTPNQGVDLTNIYHYLPDFPSGTSPDQMRPGSDFLQHLNSGITGENYTTIAGIECSYCYELCGIGSVAFCREDCISKGKEGIGSDKSYLPGWFSAEDVRLEGARPYPYLLADHTELRTKAQVGKLVMDILTGEQISSEDYWDVSEHRVRLFFKCPVSIAVTDQYGQVIDAGNV